MASITTLTATILAIPPASSITSMPETRTVAPESPAPIETSLSSLSLAATHLTYARTHLHLTTFLASLSLCDSSTQNLTNTLLDALRSGIAAGGDELVYIIPDSSPLLLCRPDPSKRRMCYPRISLSEARLFEFSSLAWPRRDEEVAQMRESLSAKSVGRKGKKAPKPQIWRCYREDKVDKKGLRKAEEKVESMVDLEKVRSLRTVCLQAGWEVCLVNLERRVWKEVSVGSHKKVFEDEVTLRRIFDVNNGKTVADDWESSLERVMHKDQLWKGEPHYQVCVELEEEGMEVTNFWLEYAIIIVPDKARVKELFMASVAPTRPLRGGDGDDVVGGLEEDKEKNR